MNAKNRFRKLGHGSVQSEKFNNLLQNMSKETEENEAVRKKEIAEQTRVNPTNLRLIFSKNSLLDLFCRLKNVIEQNRGHIKAANVLQRYHNSRHERVNTFEKDNVLETKNEKNTKEKETKETKDIKLSESHKSHLANFRFLRLFVNLFCNLFF